MGTKLKLKRERIEAQAANDTKPEPTTPEKEAAIMEAVVEHVKNEPIPEIEIPETPKKARLRVREEEREGRRLIRALRKLLRKPDTPLNPEAISYVVAKAKEQAITTMKYLQFERQIASFYFRKQVKMDDKALEEFIGNNQVSIMNVAREYQIMLNWLFFSGYYPLYQAFRVRMEEAIRADIQAERDAMSHGVVKVPKDMTADASAAHLPTPMEVREEIQEKHELNDAAARRKKAKELFK